MFFKTNIFEKINIHTTKKNLTNGPSPIHHSCDRSQSLSVALQALMMPHIGTDRRRHEGVGAVVHRANHE